MKKTIKLTEQDLTKLVKRIINEQNRFSDMSDEEFYGQIPASWGHKRGSDEFFADFDSYDQEFDRRGGFPREREFNAARRPVQRREPVEKKGFDERFETFTAINSGLTEFPEVLREHSDTLEVLILTGNNIKRIPEWISEFKNLSIINLTGNPISFIPNSISELDIDNGGSLLRLAVSGNKDKLKKLLPTVKIN